MKEVECRVMKRKFFSGTIRWVLVTILILAIIGGGVYAYVALTATGDVTVVEALSWVGSNTFSVNLYPQESVIESLTLANASSVDLTVDFISVVTPDPGPKGLTVSVPNNLNVPATGQASFDITITAGKSAEPQAYTVEIQVDR